MTKKSVCLMSILILFWMAIPLPALAAPGTPDSVTFGYGLRLDINGARVDEALLWAAKNKVDWIALDFDWNATWPDPAHWDNYSAFAYTARLANTLGLTLVFSIQNPPAWALSEAGPNPELTAALVCDLKRLFPRLAAVELYPRANTRAGWRAAPNAARYANLLQTVSKRLESREIDLHLLAGGLTNQLSVPEDQLDTQFLQDLYAAGARPAIISLRLDTLSGLPGDNPDDIHHLRHFEQIRQVMVAHGQSQALIWVTGFDLPAAMANGDPQTQSEWLAKAYLLMRSRLYFGASLYNCYNRLPPAPEQTCLMMQDGSDHPFLEKLASLIAEN